MADTAKNKHVLALAELLDSHRGENTLVVDISEQSSWTDFFVISTVTSQAHMKGLLRFVNAYLVENSIKPFRNRKSKIDEGWTLLDCGNFIIHLMNQDMRDFYELERLWFEGKLLYHSSKSS